MGATQTTVDKILKYVYTSKKLQNAVYTKNPLMALIPKAGGFDGRSLIHAITYKNSNARNALFAVAQSIAGVNGAVGNGVSTSTAAGSNGYNTDANLTITRVKNYASVGIDQETILSASGKNAGAFISSVTQLIDGTLQTLRNDFGKDLYGDGGGSLAGGITVAALVYTVGEAVTRFEVGMALVCASSATAAIRGTTTATPMIVTAVNRSAGTITVDANTDFCATGDYLWIAGDRPTSAITTYASRLKIMGMDGWNPITAPASGDAFFGLDRSVDVTRLAGQRLDISGYQPEEGYITLLSMQAREDSEPSHIFTSFTDEKNLKLALGSRVIEEYSTVGEVGFESIKLRGPNGPVRVYADRNAPVGYARSLQMNTWELKHLGEMINKGDAGQDSGLARQILSDAFECRFSFYGNLLCYKPSANAVATLPT